MLSVLFKKVLVFILLLFFLSSFSLVFAQKQYAILACTDCQGHDTTGQIGGAYANAQRGGCQIIGHCSNSQACDTGPGNNPPCVTVPTNTPTPTLPPCGGSTTSNCCEATAGSGCDSNPCCGQDSLVCVPGAGSEGHGATCQTCMQGHLQTCVIGDYSHANSCCQAQYTCASQSSSGNNPECLTTDEINNPPTVSVQNPCTKTDSNGNPICDTAIGPIPTTVVGFVELLFRVVLSLSGGVAILMIIFSGYRLAVSSGNPERVQQAREILVSAIVGLLFIIFSLTILQIIGVDVLGLGTAGGELFFPIK